jgi:hypothetical protein
MSLELNIFISVVMGCVAAKIAHERGRNPYWWFIVGTLCCWGIPAIISLVILPNLREIAAKEIKNNEDKRRLLEQLQQTQLKLQVFQRITNERIDHHDGVLGLDTKAGVAPQSLLPGATPHQLTPPPLPAAQPVQPVPVIWHYVVGDVQHGPVTASQLVDLMSARTISRDTLVWNQEMASWLPMKDTPEFRNYH